MFETTMLGSPVWSVSVVTVSWAGSPDRRSRHVFIRWCGVGRGQAGDRRGHSPCQLLVLMLCALSSVRLVGLFKEQTVVYFVVSGLAKPRWYNPSVRLTGHKLQYVKTQESVRTGMTAVPSPLLLGRPHVSDTGFKWEPRWFVRRSTEAAG